MKIVINEGQWEETEIIINCKKADDRIIRLAASLRSLDNAVTGMKEGQTFILSPEDILYIESVDKRTFIYTCGDVYESPLRLYEFEERLTLDSFFRASKSTVINLSGVISLRPDLGGRLILTMNNGEKMTVSRQYAGVVKQKLGI